MTGVARFAPLNEQHIGARVAKRFERIDAVARRAGEIRLPEHRLDFGSERQVGVDLVLRSRAQRRRSSSARRMRDRAERLEGKGAA